MAQPYQPCTNSGVDNVSVVSAARSIPFVFTGAVPKTSNLSCDIYQSSQSYVNNPPNQEQIPANRVEIFQLPPPLVSSHNEDTVTDAPHSQPSSGAVGPAAS